MPKQQQPMNPSNRATWETFQQRTAADEAFEKTMWERYGYGELSPGTLQEAFEKAVRPEGLGFTRSRPGWYARSVGNAKDMFHVLRYFLSKGGRGVFMWGVSLTFVPLGWFRGGSVRWHRTLRSVQMDHCEDVSHHVALGGKPPAPYYRLFPPTIYGDEAYHEHVGQAWDLLRPIALRWYETITDIATVVDRIDRIRIAVNEPTFSRTAYPFCLARLGRMEEARAELAAQIAAWEIDGTHVHRALEEVAADSA